eukprot:2340884-Amphidinium_carterae.1
MSCRVLLPFSPSVPGRTILAREVRSFSEVRIQVAMAGLAESKAYLTEHLEVFGVPHAFQKKLVDAGFTTFAKLAYARVNDGDDLPDAELANMRRAYAEAKAVVVYDMKKKFDASSTESGAHR